MAGAVPRAASRLFGLCLALGLLAGTASARAVANYYYSLDDVYSTAVRYVRIDRGCTIGDHDPQSAYVLFECKEGSQRRRGALELFRSGDGVRVQVTLSDEPQYMEERFLELFGRKLRDERGPSYPPVKPRPPERNDKQKDAPDGGAHP